MSVDSNDKLDYVATKLDTVADTCAKIDKDLTLHKAIFDAHLKQDERMYEEFKRMNDILADNTESLKEHMHRTSLLEKAVVNMDRRLSPIEIEHIEKRAVSKYAANKLRLIGRFAGAVTALAGIWMLLKNYIIGLVGQ